METHWNKKLRKQKSTAIAMLFGAGNQNRTDDLVITNDVLYRLSHTSMSCDFVIISNILGFVNSFLKNIFIFYLFNAKGGNPFDFRLSFSSK